MLVVEKEKIKEWVKELARKTPVFAPVRRKEHGAEESIFEEFEQGTPLEFSNENLTGQVEIDVDYLPTFLSIKDFFLPAKEDIFVVNKGGDKISVSPKTRPFILFGLNSSDLEALTQLDEIMAKPKEDFFYFKKRKTVTIVGLINEPIKTPSGGDLILIKINENQYQVFPLTPKGKNLTKNRFFKEEAAVISSGGFKSSNEIMPQLKQFLQDPELLADAVNWSWKHSYPIWEELSNLCLGCGICAYVCPLCYCFSIEDKIELDGKTCQRCRQWDACTLPRFSQISGGYNFHKTIKEKYYNWYFHKFVRAYKEYGKSQCVACGRCQKYCPAKIDIEKYLVRIVNNYKKAFNIS